MTLPEILAGSPHELGDRIFSAISKKALALDEAQEHYRKEAIPITRARLKLFDEGRLFQCQGMTFDMWLEGKYHRSDLQTWHDFDGDAYVAGMKCRDWQAYDPRYSKIRYFACERIYPTLNARRHIQKNEDALEQAKEHFVETNGRFHWQWG